MADAKQPAGAQTLSRGLSALEVVADAEGPLKVNELAERLGLHRSITYRLVRTLEEHGFVVRDASGAIELGPKLAALARNVSRDLQAAALPELTLLANELGMTAFLATVDADSTEVVTLASVEPRRAPATVSERPGNRHPVQRGAPGRAILRLLHAEPGPLPYETSHDEVIPGLSSIAVPLAARGHRPAALAVVYLSQPVDAPAIGARLLLAAESIRSELS